MAYNLPTISSMHTESEKELRKRIPRLQTSPSEVNSNDDATVPQTNPSAANRASTVGSSMKSPVSASRQRFVLTDHVAFRYLEEDASVTVLSRRQKLQGYEVYLVEQWACSRRHATFIITTYTGDPKDTVWASVISVPADESLWSTTLKVYFQSLDEYHARRKETTLGTLMITNLSGFPSSLTVIPIPDGDLKKYRELFFVNENLKRLGCSGRLGIKLATPSSATQAKFHQLYRTSDKIPLNSAVIELVKLCQVALVMFGMLEPEYVDGLLCDVTEKAVNDWWVEFGAEYYAVEPHDGILGPTTVAGLLGMLMGARNRLSAYNAPVAKDVFDIESTKRGIAYFQKTQRIQKTRRLDRQTLERLRRATAKAASKEGWGMPRALKTTVAELGGKGGEMVMGMVGAGDKAGIADIETVDIDRFVELVQGARSKWLWYGKPRKTNTGDMFDRLPGEDGLGSPEEQPSEITRLLKRESTLGEHKVAKQDTTDEKKIHADVFGAIEDVDKEKDSNSKRAVIKRATGKMESGSGFTRLKDAVGRRNHQPKSSKDEIMIARSPVHQAKSEGRESATEISSTASPRRLGTDFDPSFTKALTETPRDSASTLGIALDGTGNIRSDEHTTQPAQKTTDYDDSDRSKPPTVENSIAGSIFREVEEIEDIEDIEELPFAPTVESAPVLLRRTQSGEQIDHYHAQRRDENWWPRHLSFSIAEESVLTWQAPTSAYRKEEEYTNTNVDSASILRAKLTAQELISEDAKRLRHRLAWLSAIEASWTSTRVQTISDLEAQAEADMQELEDMYYPRLEEYSQLREDMHEIISNNRHQLQDAARDLETLGAKLEYEISSLRSKVDDVDDGVQELERQVEFVEDRLRELEDVVKERESWMHWSVRMLTGIGRPPG